MLESPSFWPAFCHLYATHSIKTCRYRRNARSHISVRGVRVGNTRWEVIQKRNNGLVHKIW